MASRERNLKTRPLPPQICFAQQMFETTPKLESLRTGTTYPMYRGSSGAQTPDSLGAGPSCMSSGGPNSKHSTLSAQVCDTS